MKTSTAWSFLAFSLAVASYAMSRDISANIFLVGVFVIQGLKTPDGSNQERRATFLACALAVGVILFAAFVLAGAVELDSPAPFRYRN